jgi:signal transduction histidine kinase
MSNAAHRRTVAETEAARLDRRVDAQRRRALALDEEKRAFLRLASHELRTPLNAILGFSEIISGELYEEYAAIIQASGHRLLRLVNQILEIARLEGRATDLDLRPEALDTALDDAIEGLREEIAARGVRLIVVGRGTLPVVTADPRGLRSLLGNLIHNAVAHPPEGSTVRIGATEQDGWVEVEVADNGPGVEARELPRLLRPFEQGEDALTRRNEGAGLGLPICDLLCQAMGGRLRLDSAPGAGFKARVRLLSA